MIASIINFRFNQYRNLALQKLGRNLHNFSLLERLLKYIVTVSEVRVTGSTQGPIIHGKTNKNIEKTQRMMLGQLVAEVLVLWNPELKTQSVTHDLFDAHIQTSMKLDMTVDDYHGLKGALSTLLQDRNFLIHQFNEKFVLNTIDNCREAIDCLDEMRERHLATIQNIQEIVKTFMELTLELPNEVKRLTQ